MELSQEEFNLLRNYIHEICGISIQDNKQYLVQQRLEPLVRASNCKSFAEYYHKITKSFSPNTKELVIDAITTNETSFFRDIHPFEAFRDHILPVLGKMIRERKQRNTARRGAKVNVWSAASSTGQEPYTLAMLIYEYARANAYLDIAQDDFRILATDISTEALAKALAGKYNEMEIKRGLPPGYLDKYFEKKGNEWVIQDALRSMVEFRQINLINPFNTLGSFDVIFCRNVLIYFDDNAKTRIFDQFYQMLANDGFFLLGSSENIYGMTDKFSSLRYGATIVYKKI